MRLLSDSIEDFIKALMEDGNDVHSEIEMCIRDRRETGSRRPAYALTCSPRMSRSADPMNAPWLSFPGPRTVRCF